MNAENELKVRVEDAAERQVVYLEDALCLPNAAKLQKVLLVALSETAKRTASPDSSAYSKFR